MYDRLPPPKNNSKELFISHGYYTENLPHEGSKIDWKKEFKKSQCCNRKHTYNCGKLNSSFINGSRIFDKNNVTLLGIFFTYKKNVSPYAYVYVTENGEEALIYYNKFKNRIRGSFTLNDGRSFAFHICFIGCLIAKSGNIKGIFNFFNTKCLAQYIIYQFDQNYLRSKEIRNDVIDVASTKSLPHPILRKSEKEYSIMFYYTKKFAMSHDFIRSNSLMKDYFEELIHKTNLGYNRSNIPIKARMHCFEMATIEENVSENMSVILDKFRNMKETPENLRNFADVAVLIINDVKDSCGISYGHAYRNGWTFSVVSRDCAISQLTFSHGISHNFGADHSEHPLNITNHYHPNIIHPMMKTRIGKPANFMHFSKHIDKISSLGNESCVCYKAYNMKKSVKWAHMGLEESCNFHQVSMKRPGTKPLHDVLYFRIKDQKDTKKKDNDIRNQKPLSKDLYTNFLTERQNLFEKYLKTAQKLYETYLKDAHNKIHERGYKYVHLLGNGD